MTLSWFCFDRKILGKTSQKKVSVLFSAGFQWYEVLSESMNHLFVSQCMCLASIGKNTYLFYFVFQKVSNLFRQRTGNTLFPKNGLIWVDRSRCSEFIMI